MFYGYFFVVFKWPWVEALKSVLVQVLIITQVLKFRQAQFRKQTDAFCLVYETLAQ